MPIMVSPPLWSLKMKRPRINNIQADLLETIASRVGLGHDNHRRLSKLYAWEEKKSKTSWGGETVTGGDAMKRRTFHNPKKRPEGTAQLADRESFESPTSEAATRQRSK